MIPAKIEDVFIQITTDINGVILSIDAGKFAEKEFTLHQSVYRSCPFLEGTLEALPYNEPFLIEAMIIHSNSIEYNVDVEIFKREESISVLIHNRTNVYKYVDQLNQKRNDIFFIKREIAEKNKELDRLRKIADKANEEKSRFLAMISHEIRNPLNVILGYSEMIAEENADVQKYINSLLDAGHNLKVIVEDILDLSRIEAGKLELVSEQISITKIVETCIANFYHQQKTKEVKLEYFISEKVPTFILGDSVRITQVLSNLMSNAIKFTKKGIVKIDVEAVSETAENAVLKFVISDTGRGMTNDQVAKIFEEYQQTEINDNRVFGGAGLGLAIVKRLVHAMNGVILVESKIDKGTRFSIEISFKKVVNHTLPQKQKNVEVNFNSLKGRRILVADDDVLNQTIVAHILNKEKTVTTIVNDGLEALDKISKESFDVILLDINMPNMTGEDLMRQRDLFDKLNIDTPFLALTANTSSKDVQRYLSLGFSGIISKPYTATEFVEKIKKVLP
ncbi:ATP-binding protein [Polaribacter sp. MSW13]|uniref:histidine kinase n=1 Tax=Polaribacter marinus TaxID=2916838 RepID=A0A9X1VKV5_9FLAO|nr:ATP-binding protein [Polaribacter marinus]MCI2227868.1 ATP-binding protein [Polaribacter marinus]